ncbi:MAG TPA: ABC transporter permease [Candidatus Coatesbacteria bacterium]|nr:ABC transporter permease [Candidatus Coatesbacteria bacterium]
MNNLKLALRGVTRNKRRSAITVAAIAVALALIVLINSILDGTYRMMNDKAVEASGHVQIYAPGYYDERRTMPTDIAIGRLSLVMEALRSTPGVVEAAAQITFGGLAAFAGNEVGGVFMGLEPEAAGRIHRFPERVVQGRYLAEEDADACLVGYRLAELLGLELGDALTVVTRTSYGALTAVDLTVVGVVATMNPLIDEGGALMLLEDAQRYLELPDAATAIIVNGSDPMAAGELEGKVLTTLASLVPADEGGAFSAAAPNAADDSVVEPTREGFETYTWQELSYVILEMAEMQQQMMNIIRAIMVILAMAMIISTMLTNVFERTREIGVLLAMGAKGRQVLLVFLGEAAVLGLIGSLVGTAVGTGLGLLLQNVGLDFGEGMTTLVNVPMESVIYALVTPEMVLGAFLTGLATSVVAGLYPAAKAARLQPTKALRFI